MGYNIDYYISLNLMAVELGMSPKISLQILSNQVHARAVSFQTQVLRTSLADTQADNTRPVEDHIVSAGIHDVHSALHTPNNTDYDFRKISPDLYTLGEQSDTEFLSWLQQAIQNSDEVIKRRGSKVLEQMESLYPEWAEKVFNTTLTDETRAFLFDPPAIVIEWDHHRGRELFGAKWGLPPNSTTEMFGLWKMSEYPPTFFLSDQYANSSKLYIKDIANQLGLSPQEVLNRSVAHEKAHRVITKPITDLLLEDSSFSWWSEAVAIAYSDFENYFGTEDTKTEREKNNSFSKTINPEGSLSYAGALACWYALCSLKAQSINLDDIYTASDELIGIMINHAAQSDGNKIPSHQIPDLLESDIGMFDDKVLTQTKNEMLEMMAIPHTDGYNCQ